METAYLNSPVGLLEIKGDASGLFSVTFIENSEKEESQTPSVLQDTVTQLTQYFEGTRTHFSLKLAPEGTNFQKRVWQELQEIPFGKTTSYQQMANQLGDPKVIRAAASANGKNPIAIVIPFKPELHSTRTVKCVNSSYT
jgi:methylated-DNA-[protein]-cysteine S-methyltransferase